MFKSILCLVITSVICVNAVTVQNNTSYQLKLQNFSFISGKEIGLFPVAIKPDSIFSWDDIAYFEMCANGKSRIIENLKDSDHIIVTWSNDDLVVEFQN